MEEIKIKIKPKRRTKALIALPTSLSFLPSRRRRRRRRREQLLRDESRQIIIAVAVGVEN